MPLTVTLLSLCQALLVTGNVLLIAVSPLIGASLAPSASWSTASVATQWLGLMCATIPASLIMAKLGRKRGFILGNMVGLVGALVAVQALMGEHFGLFLLATWLIGIGIGFGQLYRFAAVEAAPATMRDRAIGLVMGGGVLAAFAGPWLARVSRELGEVPFLGSFVGLAVLYALALVVLMLTQLPPASRTHGEGVALPLGKILRQPGFIVAVSAATVGYGVMNLAMTATPLAMAGAGHHFNHVSMTIQWHVVAMFLPSFFTGHLATRFGAKQVIVAGCLLLVASAVVAQFGIGLAGFNVALILLGLGWNFTFLPATGLLTESYRPVDKARTQAANEFLVFGTAAVTALLAGPLVSSLGWATLNLLLIPVALVPLAVLAWQHKRTVALS
ncbi:MULTISPECIES: MFS transporter [unclassified Halomonas]|uniref:MFS transporter n=1 Tax=unclassified Halomonas TaxID=2609666 RepID=UPI0007D9B6BE|nr:MULTISPECIES: MFS transporter [unclassified Halomonas]MBT2786113.1 MFS transporter [Halomonas sp. ISL-106]MBT2797135.1 MFS transporter [Halomonas sp. ISL-104]OAL58516.1 MFS transporter [Halomonas sp. ALS9]